MGISLLKLASGYVEVDPYVEGRCWSNSDDWAECYLYAGVYAGIYGNLGIDVLLLSNEPRYELPVFCEMQLWPSFTGDCLAPGDNGEGYCLLENPPNLVAVPNVVGMTEAAAGTALTGAGLVVGTVSRQNSATVPIGQVISQDPVANVAQGTSINLIVSLGPEGTEGAPYVSWGTYLGETFNNFCSKGIAVDSSGNVYVTGSTDSSGWVSGGWDTTYHGGTRGWDGYVVKLSAAGAHVWSTYLGGTDDDMGDGITVDLSGNIYATGYTYSPGWVSGGWDTTLDGTSDAYVVKLSTAGAHIWSTYLGGTGIETGDGIAVDSSGNVYATGDTTSSSWASGGWDISYDGSGFSDAYVVKLSAAGAHVWSTYLGGTNSNDTGYGIAVDSSGNVYASGYTESSGWVSGGWDTILDGIGDGYVVKLSTAGAHIWSTYLGGMAEDSSKKIAVDSNGDAYVTGWTTSSGWVSGGWDTSYNGGDDGCVVKLSAAGSHLWSSYLGGTSNDTGYGIAVDSSGNVYASGYTSSSNWVSGGWDTIYDGWGGFLLKIIDSAL
jgi:hypothetical protein